jgi:hypothetical protein
MSSGVHRSRVRQSVIWGAVVLVAVAAALAFARPAAAWTEPTQPSFTDVPTSNAFYRPIEAVGAAGTMTGYVCGGVGEPCDSSGRPYFRPYSYVTRGQAALFVARAINAIPATSPAQVTFADVPAGNPYHDALEGLAARGTVSGYACGGPGEPCDAQARPYFRPYTYVTRAQASKMIALAGGADLTTAPVTASFADVLAGNPFHPAVEWLFAHSGSSGYSCGGPGEPCDVSGRPYFRPYNNVTRGQLAKMVAFPLILSDMTGPAISMTPPLVEATGSGGAAVIYDVSGSDPDDPVKQITCAPASGSTFPLGTTPVSCTADDTHLNTTTATFVVTVRDTTPPALLGLSSPISVDATSPSGAVVYYAQPTARDLVDGSLKVGCAPLKGSLFPIGTTVVNCSAVDAHGNVASGAFTVTVNGASAQIAALIKKLDGSSLAKALYAAQDALRIPDLEGACAALTRFGDDVRAAEAARQLGSTEASSLLSSLGQIRTVAGCKP